MQPVRKPLANLASIVYSKAARICLSRTNDPHIKIFRNGHLIEELPLDLEDRKSTSKAIAVIKYKIYGPDR